MDRWSPPSTSLVGGSLAQQLRRPVWIAELRLLASIRRAGACAAATAAGKRLLVPGRTHQNMSHGHVWGAQAAHAAVRPPAAGAKTSTSQTASVQLPAGNADIVVEVRMGCGAAALAALRSSWRL